MTKGPTGPKGGAGPFFEDFDLGQRIRCPTPRRLGEGEAAAYIALTGDRTPRYSGAAGLVHPLVVFHTVMGQTVRPVSLNARANLGYAGMRWGGPVRLGSVLSTEVEVLGLKENSNRATGIVWVRTTGRDQDGREVLSYVRWVMVRKRGEAPTRWLEAPSVPSVPGPVKARELCLGGLDPLPDLQATGGRHAFEDYAPGERVFHLDGQTVNASDHMAFTRLFQNSARLHFDAVLTHGDPLVYGGYPISLGYAQAFNGFENRLGLAAVNGGAHANPVHAGDTLYSFSEVVEADPLGDAPVGALRVHLYVLKGVEPSTVPALAVRAADGKGYREEVVLDLDLWELVAKRG
ncbi:MAG: hypothetical protein HY722_12820 [Planctomycetes bacterium]|nr:hypothetical protein [Planctomycetota bacterium]